MSDEIHFEILCNLKKDDYIMLESKSRYAKSIIHKFGQYWIIDDIRVVNDIPSIVLARCILQEKLRGGEETLTIDRNCQLNVALNDDENFNYEQVIYEQE